MKTIIKLTPDQIEKIIKAKKHEIFEKTKKQIRSLEKARDKAVEKLRSKYENFELMIEDDADVQKIRKPKGRYSMTPKQDDPIVPQSRAKGLYDPEAGWPDRTPKAGRKGLHDPEAGWPDRASKPGDKTARISGKDAAVKPPTPGGSRPKGRKKTDIKKKK